MSSSNANLRPNRASLGLASMAWRNLWRNRRRTGITLAGIVFGILLSVVITGMTNGTYSQMIDYAAHLGSGHVAIQHTARLDTPTVEHSVRLARALRDETRARREVEAVLPRISCAALLATADGNAGIRALGIDTTLETETTLPLLKSLRSPSERVLPRDGIWIGATLRENLGTRRGRKVVLTVTDRHGEVVSILARVAGILDTGAPTIDGALAILPASTLQRALGYAPDVFTTHAVMLDSHDEAQAVADWLNVRLPAPSRALRWDQIQPDLAAFIAADGATGILIQAIVLLLLGAGVFNTLLVSVMERAREFGILRALGFTPANVFALVAWESLWLAMTGILAGALMTAWPYHHLAVHGIDMSGMIQAGSEVSGVAMQPILPVRVTVTQVGRIAMVVLGATMLAGLYPAWRASRLEPAATIRR